MKSVTSKKSEPTTKIEVTTKAEAITKSETTKKLEPDVRVLKSATCQSLSGKSKLTYEVGATSSNDLRLRIVANSGNGSFRQEWVELREIRAALDKVPKSETVASDCLIRLFVQESANQPSFVFAVLLHEGLVRRSAKERRRYERVEPEAFDAAIKALSEGKGASAVVDAKATKAKGKKAAPDKARSASRKK